MLLDDDVALVQSEFEHKPTDKLTQESKRSIDKTVLAFSDCLVISVPVQSPLAKLQGDFDVIMSELTSFAWAQGACVLHGIFCEVALILVFCIAGKTRS